MINQLKNPIVIVSVTTLVLLLNVGGWSTSTRKKDLRAYPGTIRGTEKWDDTYKIRLLSKEISTTSKTISVLQDAEPKMRGLCMLI